MAINFTRMRLLASQGLVADDERNKFILAIRRMEKGRRITFSQRDILNRAFFNILEQFSEDSLFYNRERKFLREKRAEEKELERLEEESLEELNKI